MARYFCCYTSFSPFGSYVCLFDPHNRYIYFRVIQFIILGPLGQAENDSVTPIESNAYKVLTQCRDDNQNICIFHVTVDVYNILIAQDVDLIMSLLASPPPLTDCMPDLGNCLSNRAPSRRSSASSAFGHIRSLAPLRCGLTSWSPVVPGAGCNTYPGRPRLALGD